MSIRNYITENKNQALNSLRFRGIEVEEIDPLPDSISLRDIVKYIVRKLPSHFFQHLDKIRIQHLPEFDERHITAVYKDDAFYITNQQENMEDILDDVVHEFAHHVETLYTDFIYKDGEIAQEFKKKRKQLEFELKSEGYWTSDYDFNNIDYNADLDKFLYNRVGKNMLKMATTGLFIRPYAAISLREYFATGFEAYYLDKKNELAKISPVLYNVINMVHNS
jgi:hypothetical protein